MDIISYDKFEPNPQVKGWIFENVLFTLCFFYLNYVWLNFVKIKSRDSFEILKTPAFENYPYF